MAAPNDQQVFRIPGILYKGTTGFATSGQYGTALGATRAHRVRYMGKTPLVLAEEYKSAPIEGSEPADWIILSCLVRQWDDAAIAALNQNTSTGSSSGKKLVTGAVKGTVLPGHNRSAAVDKYLFVADNPTDHESIYLPRGMLFLARESESMYSILQERNLEASLVSLPDGAATRRTYQMGRLADFTL